MDINALSQKSGSVSPPDCSSDPDEKEISDDDDDRNHKHRRPDSESQSLERDSLEQASSQPFRKRNRTVQNGQSDPQFQHNSIRDFSKRRLTGTNFSRFSGQHGSGRGRGTDFQRDPWFCSIDGASQMAHPGSIPPPMFTGRGLPGPNAQSASWSGFGLVPTISNGTIDAVNPLGVPGMLGPQINPSMNMGMCQRCRDFEERGFCLRGDMCPMEHGVNRIVVEDVQSLSHFNLPLSLPSAQMLGTSAGGGFVSPAGVSNTLMNSRGPHNLMKMSSVDEQPLASTVDASGADVYDPDQPLWNNDARETSNPLVELQHLNFDENVSCMDTDLSDRLVRSSGDALGGQSTSSSVWGRLRNSKNKLELKGKFDVRANTSDFPTKEICEPSGGTQGMTHVGKQTIGALSGSITACPISKLPNDVGGTIRKSSQKAECTLFVNCVPLKDNKRENLLSHFRKFGEVVDIYIPANSERAFVQFSKREEAEKALKAPDAVMGSRFIKLLWANRDNIVINGVTPPDVMAASGSTQIPGFNRGKDNMPCAAPKVVVRKASASNIATESAIKPVAVNSPRGVPSLQKKMESLELLKEELRKKQEMLEQKQNEFRQQLDKLSKHASRKGEVPAVPAEKSQISKTSSKASKAGNSQSSEIVSLPSAAVDTITIENLASERAKAKSACALHDRPLKRSISAVATSGALSLMTRYKLDNRPRTFRINAPLPERLINVSVLRDHFSSFGQISNLKIEDSGEEESRNVFTDSEEMTRNCSAQVSFATRQAAERAFLDGKSWHGHNLQFNWVTSSIPTSNQISGESSSVLKRTASIEAQSTEKTVNDDPKKTLDLKESNSSPPKSSNELSCDGSRSSLKSSPDEKNSASEVHSPDKSSLDKSTGNFPSEADEPENRGLERQEQVAGDHQRTG